jgi:transcriptional regulator with AAA-type ATPase domain
LALDFASFLLRYHKDLEYADFTEDNNVQDLIRRAEAFRQWADIEDLAATIDQITQVFEQHRTTAANAMSEIFQHTEKIKRDVMDKISETSSALTDLRGEQETALKVMESVKVDAVKPIEPEVTLEDLNIMKRMIFEMKDFTTQTDNFVR